ncbi:cyclic nucleotide-binding domain protein (macronuclear) [Tetrahymena thermophila SB210]|uniref:Cyclic nucleotide-binding domain protein n=1 Tax=Tetrahymena thermophila (strain SB210) TaxID=312017 RepID=Q22U90_TETTS|nr:cyclic nucleotide-binding domain protein [Tetrahymena thermophila SB210]EAR88797.2 cyclic nucleotide-binding domain protein [Tetrahymena thermophila SB210]|eukprot:XP_001009042.2 cyclic nucleotide-binding domain protein [Tetrahymena thermophila SB210]
MTEIPKTTRIISQHQQNIPKQNAICSIQLLNDNEDQFKEDQNTQQQLTDNIYNFQSVSNAFIFQQNEKTEHLFDSIRQDSNSTNQSFKNLNETQRQIIIQTLLQSQKNPQESKVLLQIIQSLPAFRENKIQNEKLIDSFFFENIELISLSKGSCVFNFGDQSDGYYTLLEGFCYVTIPKEKIKKHLEKLNENKFKDENLRRAYKVLSQSDFQSIQEYFKFPALKHITNQVTIKILDAGSSFGEISMLFGKKRTASVICGSECKIMKISKKNFEKLVDKEEQITVLNQRLEFLSQISFLNDLPKIIILTLIQESEILNLQRGANIYKQGDKADSVYVIQEGTIQICKKIPNQVAEKERQKQQSSLYNQPDIKLKQQSQKDAQQISRSNTLNRYEKSSYQIQQTEMQPIVLLDKGQYFGEDQVFSPEQIRNSQAQVQSPQAVVIGIKMNILVPILIEYNCLDVLFKELDLKQQFNSRRQQLIQTQNQKQSQKKIKLQSNLDMIQQVQQSLMSNRDFFSRSINTINQQDSLQNIQQESQNFILSQKRILSPMTSPKSCRFDSQKTNLNFEMKLDKRFSQQNQNQSPKLQKKQIKQDKNDSHVKSGTTIQKINIERDIDQNQEIHLYNAKEQIDQQNNVSKYQTKKINKIDQVSSKNKSSSEMCLDGKKINDHFLFQIKSAQFGTQATNTTLNTIPSQNNINIALINSNPNNQNSLKQSHLVKTDFEIVQSREFDDMKSPKNNNIIQKIDFDFLKQQYMQLSTLTKLKQIKQEHIKRKDHFRQLQESSQKQTINIQQEQLDSQGSSPLPLPLNKQQLKKNQQIKPKLDLLNYLYERGIETERIVYKERRNPQTDRSPSDQNQIKLTLSKEQFFQKENAQNSLMSQLTSGLNKYIKTDQKITENNQQALKVIPAIYIEDSLNLKITNQQNCKTNTINSIENDKSSLNLTNRTLRSQNLQPLSKQNSSSINLHTLNLPKISFQQKPYIRMKQFSLHHINKTSEQN